MALFTTKELPPNLSMITTGIMLVPSSPQSEEAVTYIPPSSGPTIDNSVLFQEYYADNEFYKTGTVAEPKQPTVEINFAESFKNWTLSPVLNNIYKQDIKIPTILLKEYRLLNSTVLQQMKYFSYIFFTGPERAAEDLSQLGAPGWVTNTLKTTQAAIDAAFEITKSVIGSLGLRTPDLESVKGEDPYDGIYDLSATGFKYILPLYTANMKSKINSFGDSYSGDGVGILPSLLQGKDGNYVRKFAENRATGARILVEPGIYIEKTQFYNFGSNTESITFNFPLLNTVSKEQIDENYQFLFLLIFQNTLYRKDRAAFIPPCIYEVLVPGIRYMKHAFISTLKVDFVGTRRMIEVDSGIGKFKTIVPEAYNVSLTLTGLHEEGGNFIIRSAANNFEDIKIRDITDSPSTSPLNLPQPPPPPNPADTPAPDPFQRPS